MKHEVSTLNTKKALANSLKKYMAKKPLSKITVSEIITDCDVNRKTFYYHFEDIYALLKWMLEQEAIEVVKQFDLLVEYSDAILFVVDYVEKNKYILNCAYDSMGRDELRRFFSEDFFDVISGIIGRIEREKNIALDDDFKSFLTEFYTEAIAGMLINFFKQKDNSDREKILRYTALIWQSSIKNILLAKANDEND